MLMQQGLNPLGPPAPQLPRNIFQMTYVLESESRLVGDTGRDEKEGSPWRRGMGVIVKDTLKDPSSVGT